VTLRARTGLHPASRREPKVTQSLGPDRSDTGLGRATDSFRLPAGSVRYQGVMVRSEGLNPSLMRRPGLPVAVLTGIRPARVAT
jgi:hypothetical protein